MKIKITLLLTVLLLTINSTILAQESTTVLLEKAQIEAAKEKKAIFIKFEASWCGWCHKMTKDMKASNTKDFFNNNYVIVPIVVNEAKGKEKLENPGARDLLKKYNGDKAGLPFWLILDADLKVITDSFDANGQNLGGPGSPDEVATFINKLKKSTKEVTALNIANIKKQFTLIR